MGFHINATVKCHTCKRKRRLGGNRKIGTSAAAEKSGWKLITLEKMTGWVWLCPECARKNAAAVAKK